MVKPRIVVVDDDVVSRLALSELFVLEGFDPVAFESGDAAWAAISQGQVLPDDVISDVVMLGMDGIGLLQRIRAQFPAVPVVLISAFVNDAVWTRGMRAGALAVFSKPIRDLQLVRSLYEALSAGRA